MCICIEDMSFKSKISSNMEHALQMFPLTLCVHFLRRMSVGGGVAGFGLVVGGGGGVC